MTEQNHNTQTKDLAIRDPFQLMDLMDDEAVLAEMQGQITDKWAYVFTDGGQEVAGLSKVGVDQATREMAKQGEVVDEDEITYSVDPTDDRYVLFQAKVTRVAVSKDGTRIPLEKKYGHKRQCLNIITKKEGVTDRPNQFWYEQGSAKALRNATSRVIPEEIRVKIIAYAKEHGKARRVEQEKTSSGIQPPKPKATAKAPQTNGNGHVDHDEVVIGVIQVHKAADGTKPASVKINGEWFSYWDKKIDEVAIEMKTAAAQVDVFLKHNTKDGKTYKNVVLIAEHQKAELPPEQQPDPNSPM